MRRYKYMIGGGLILAGLSVATIGIVNYKKKEIQAKIGTTAFTAIMGTSAVVGAAGLVGVGVGLVPMFKTTVVSPKLTPAAYVSDGIVRSNSTEMNLYNA